MRMGAAGIGARVIEMASRVRLAFAAACPDASLIRHIATALMPGPLRSTTPGQWSSASRR